MALDPLFLAELSERLFVHYAQARWMAPLSHRLLQVTPFRGHIVCGDARDLARAAHTLRPSLTQNLAEVYTAIAPALRALRRLEGGDDDAGAPVAPVLPGAGPLMLLSDADTPLAHLAGALIAGVPRGVVWVPSPRAAASAHLLMRALGPRAGGALALVQGDEGTRALARGQGLAVLTLATGPCRP